MYPINALIVLKLLIIISHYLKNMAHVKNSWLPSVVPLQQQGQIRVCNKYREI